MIFVFEMVGWGTYHAAANASLLRTIVAAFPTEEVRFLADETHLAEVKALHADWSSSVKFLPAPLSKHYRARPYVVSGLRAWQELRNIFQALRRCGDGQVLIVLSTSTSTSVFAAALCARLLCPARGLLQVFVHGELNEIRNARTRNPARRRFDMISSFRAKRSFPTRFVVLEQAIREAWIGMMPEMASRVDVLPHCIPVETAAKAPLPPQPLRFGLVGQATIDKGLPEFLRAAKFMKAQYGSKVAFRHVGTMPAGMIGLDVSVLEDLPQYEGLPAEIYDDRLNSLHYVCLPLKGSYYVLSASGAILDAIEHEKPLIIRNIPLSESYFRTYGDIGYLFKTDEELNDALQQAVASYGKEKYLRQVENLKRIKAARAPGASATTYRQLVKGYVQL